MMAGLLFFLVLNYSKANKREQNNYQNVYTAMSDTICPICQSAQIQKGFLLWIPFIAKK